LIMKLWMIMPVHQSSAPANGWEKSVHAKRPFPRSAASQSLSQSLFGLGAETHVHVRFCRDTQVAKCVSAQETNVHVRFGQWAGRTWRPISGSTSGSCATEIALPSGAATVSWASTGVPRLTSPKAMGPSS